MWTSIWVVVFCHVTVTSYIINPRSSNVAGGKKHDVYIAGFFPFDDSVAESEIGRGVLPAVRLAVDHINDNPTVLRNYILHLWWNDTKEEIRHLLDVAHKLKAKRKREVGNLLAGKHLVLLFEKTSTRTRCSFEVAMKDEGGHVTFLDKESSQFGKKESIEDSAKVLGRYYDAIEYRGFDQKVVEELSRHSGVPVYNGLTDVDHPTQILADMMTIEEHVKKPLQQVKIAFVGDVRNNMCYAWMYGSAKMGMHFTGLGPKELFPNPEAVARVREICKVSGGTVLITDDQRSLKGVDVIYTDVWVSMGEEKEMKKRVELLTKYRVTMEMLKATGNPEVKFMHCLPAYHDFETKVAREAKETLNLDVREVTDEVFRSSHSIVFDEAENRMHTIKAVIFCTLK